jgi:hypothetical protein
MTGEFYRTKIRLMRLNDYRQKERFSDFINVLIKPKEFSIIVVCQKSPHCLQPCSVWLFILQRSNRSTIRSNWPNAGFRKL